MCHCAHDRVVMFAERNSSTHSVGLDVIEVIQKKVKVHAAVERDSALCTSVN